MKTTEEKRIVVTFTHKGRRYYCYGKTLEEAIEKKVKKQFALKNGEVGISKNMTVKRWAQEWLDTYKKGNVSDKVYKDYQSKFRNHILPHIGNYHLGDVTDTQLQKVLNLRAGFSFDDTDKIRKLLKALFKQARISRIIVYDPAEELKMPKTVKQSYRSITEEERKYILKVCETHKVGLWIKTMMYCGLRPAETYALSWKDIDFKKQRININWTLESGSNRIKPPKTKAGIRSVPIPDSIIGDFKKKQGKPDEPVFTKLTSNARHTHESGRSYWKNFKRSLDIEMGAVVYRNQIVESKIAPDLVPYCFRHTFGTDSQDAGVSINVAKYLMGHADIQTTGNIYTDTTEYIINDAAQKMNEHLKKKQG